MTHSNDFNQHFYLAFRIIQLKRLLNNFMNSSYFDDSNVLLGNWMIDIIQTSQMSLNIVMFFLKITNF